MHSLLDSQCIEGMTVSGGIFLVTPSSYIILVKAVINKEYIIIWYNFQPCCVAGYRDITSGS